MAFSDQLNCWCNLPFVFLQASWLILWSHSLKNGPTLLGTLIYLKTCWTIWEETRPSGRDCFLSNMASPLTTHFKFLKTKSRLLMKEKPHRGGTATKSYRSVGPSSRQKIKKAGGKLNLKQPPIGKPTLFDVVILKCHPIFLLHLNIWSHSSPLISSLSKIMKLD